MNEETKKEPTVLLRFMKRADKRLNRILIPKFIIDNYGQDFYLDVYSDGTMKLTPIKYSKDKKETEE